jgi:hypothetical protein
MYDKQSRFCFVCRDAESLFFRDVLKAELGIASEIPCCLSSEKSKLGALIKNSDVLMATPTVYQELKAMASGSTIFNVLDQVDPVSLKMVKDSVLGKLDAADAKLARISKESRAIAPHSLRS